MLDLTLRETRESDLPHWVEWLNDPEVTAYTAIESGQATLEGERRWFAAITAPECPDRTWQIDAGGAHIGGCSLSLVDDGRQAELGIIIGDARAWGHGHGTRAVSELLRIGFADLKLHRIFLQVFAENAGALRCYGRCGFRQEGLHVKARWKRGRWRDTVTMALLAGERRPS